MTFYESLTPESKVIWKALMQAFDCKDPYPHHYPVSVQSDLEDLDEIEKIMSVVPGFDRGEE